MSWQFCANVSPIIVTDDQKVRTETQDAIQAREEKIRLSFLEAFLRAMEGQLFPPGLTSSSVVIFLIIGAKEHADGLKLAKGMANYSRPGKGLSYI